LLTADAVKTRARALGFDLCGVAPAESFPELAFLREWLGRQFAGTMTWLNRTVRVRSDARLIVPGARSVIVTGSLYNTNHPYSADSAPDAARVARYAWGDDYHHVVGGRLAALDAWMHETSPVAFESRPYVDTGPVQERVYAQYAGLGWIGKNTCLISPDVGSWLFLGVIITDLALTPDVQGLEQCGSCTKCLEACPTQALVEPGVLDATRCISYLTIELRAGIPVALRPQMGTQVYGCDICQEVCPYNRPAPASVDPAWQPHDGWRAPRLAEVWRRSDAEITAGEAGMALTRAPLTNLRRNLAVAIGNSGDPEARAALSEPPGPERASALDPMVREHVDWALAQPERR
jgi:epoxyqueuosine reductase